MRDPALSALARARASWVRGVAIDDHRAALRDAGFDDERVDAVADLDAPCWTSLHRAVMALADAVALDDVVLSDLDADVLDEHLDDADVLALAVAVGVERQPTRA